MSEEEFNTPNAGSSEPLAVPAVRSDFLILSAKELRAMRPTATDGPQKRDVSPSSPLTAHWKRNRVTGKGIELLEKTALLFDEGDTVLKHFFKSA